MPPKSRGKDVKGKAKATELTPEKGRSRGRRVASSSAVPDVFRDMLAEAVPSSHVNKEDRPRKRRRKVQTDNDGSITSLNGDEELKIYQSDGDESLEFEDVISPKGVQTAYNDSDDASSENDLAWEEVGVGHFASKPAGGEEGDGDLDLTLTTETPKQRKPAATRRKVVNNAERAVRLNIHKMHVLSLLSFIDRRNSWCNDKDTQNILRSLLTKQMVECLQPKESYTQFGKAESVKKGLALVAQMWESKYSITAKGVRRAYWFESEREIKEFRLHPDADNLHEKAEFRATAETLTGSRDVGAQLFCALLRDVGLDVRLVCSLQPLPFSATTKAFAPNILQNSSVTPEARAFDSSGDDEFLDARPDVEILSSTKPDSPGMSSNPRRRLGHPNAADYFMPQISTPMKTPPKQLRKPIRESQFPVFWVEVLDEAHQKWMPVNPIDPSSINRPRFFEPPASEPENNMSYVVAFEDDGAARDVTRRYTKAFNAKTRKNRVESTPEGEKWWQKTMRFYSRGYKSNLDQIEDIELAAVEAREPMPKSIADFKDHSVYALERHLRRNEVFVSAREVGKVAAGRDSSGGKKLEGVYRRRDVKTVKSADGWYRIGREVKVGEQSVKVVASRKRDDTIEEDEERAGTALYTEDQTELYEPPPVINGRVPKNAYGNLDVYVTSMVPKGGIHLSYPDTSRAARLLGIDYADAVTGFEFRGRHGTAVIKGAVVAEEHKEAIEAAIEGFRDEEAQAEEQRRSLAALVMWRKFMIGLRIKERVDGYEVEGENSHVDRAEEAAHMAREMDVDDYGGGFLPVDQEDMTEESEHINIQNRSSFLPTVEEETIENGEEVGIPHDAGPIGGIEADNIGPGEDTADDNSSDSVPAEDDSGMESEDYVDDGGGGFLTE